MWCRKVKNLKRIDWIFIHILFTHTQSVRQTQTAASSDVPSHQKARQEVWWCHSCPPVPFKTKVTEKCADPSAHLNKLFASNSSTEAPASNWFVIYTCEEVKSVSIARGSGGAMSEHHRCVAIWLPVQMLQEVTNLLNWLVRKNTTYFLLRKWKDLGISNY